MVSVRKAVGPAVATLAELEDIASSSETLGRVVESQQSLIRSQVDELNKLAETQCKLTGFNPLSEEMVADVLSVKNGKGPRGIRTRDFIRPRAIEHMHSIFSIKDTISAKEAREISAVCGITVQQVKGYFSHQRTIVRELINSSRKKAKTLISGLGEMPITSQQAPGNPSDAEGIIQKDRKPAPTQAVRLLESSDVPMKRHAQNVSSLKIKEPSKDIPVKRKTAGKGKQVARAKQSKRRCPMPANDKQKAEEPEAASSSHANMGLSADRVPQMAPRRTAEDKLVTKSLPDELEIPIVPEMNSISKKDQLQWQIQPGIFVYWFFTLGYVWLPRKRAKKKRKREREKRKKENGIYMVWKRN